MGTKGKQKVFCDVLFKTDPVDQVLEGVPIKLSLDYDEENDDDVFHFCNSMAELESLKDPDNPQDFVVLKIYD